MPCARIRVPPGISNKPACLPSQSKPSNMREVKRLRSYLCDGAGQAVRCLPSCHGLSWCVDQKDKPPGFFSTKTSKTTESYRAFPCQKRPLVFIYLPAYPRYRRNYRPGREQRTKNKERRGTVSCAVACFSYCIGLTSDRWPFSQPKKKRRERNELLFFGTFDSFGRSLN